MNTIEDHNDRVERAALIGLVGIYAFVAFFVFSVFLILIFTTITGTQLILSIIAIVLTLVMSVFAVWFATMSPTAILVFQWSALVAAVYMLGYAIYETILFFQFLRSDMSTVESLFLAVFGAVVFTLFSYILLALEITFFVTGLRFYNLHKRQTQIEEMSNPTPPPASTTPGESDIESPTPSAPPFNTALRHRAIGVTLNSATSTAITK
jgi:hypothetical protein